jgi:HPr serine kinase-like protein
MIRNPDLPLHGHFSAAGSRWSVRSNSLEVLQAVAETLPRLNHRGRATLNVDIYVDPSAGTNSFWSVPQFRGRDHLVFADYGPDACMLADLRARHVIGRFAPATVHDVSYWKRTILPILLGVAAPVVGVTALHCACLQYKGEGLLITGESGAGKSTLSFELARRGLDFVSDDWTYFSRAGAEVLAWGLPTNIKLLPDAIVYFPELHDHGASIHLNGELALEVTPEEVNAKRSVCSRPGRIFVLERQPGLGFEAARLAPNEIAAYFQQSLERLPACVARSREAQLTTIRSLAQVEAWHLRCGGNPQEIATYLLQFCDGTFPRPAPVSSPLQLVRREWPDMLRRFVALPCIQPFSFDSFQFQVASDSERILRALSHIAEPAPVSTAPFFSWAIQEESAWPRCLAPPTGLSCGSLSFLSFGQHSFLACDRRAGRAISFVAAATPDRELEGALETMLLHLADEGTATPLRVPPGFALSAGSDVTTS